MSSAYFDVAFICLLLLALADGCKYTKQHGYLAADCSSLHLEKIPANLRTDTEVLDVSDNRISELKNHTFTCCTSIKFLYLQTNVIFEIDSHAFAPLTELTVLDLSFNVLLTLPANLPLTLQRLYLDQNKKLFHNASAPNTAVELKIAPLKNLIFLSIAKCSITKFPKFGGSIPNLVQLNITANPLEEITPQDLAPLCQLKFLHVSPDTLFQTKEKLCSCHQLAHWTRTNDIKVESFTCKYDKSTSLEKCDPNPSNGTVALYQSCLTEMKNRQVPYWLMAGGGVLAVIACICVLLYVRYRRRQRETTKNGRDRGSAVKYENKAEEKNGGVKLGKR